MKTLSLTIIGIAFLISACTKPDKCPFYFQIPSVVISPQKEYHIGDTIMMVSRFHRKVTGFNAEENAIKPFDMEGIFWLPGTVIHKIDTVGQVSISSIDKNFIFLHNPAFDYNSFTFSDGSNVLQGEYNYSNDTFLLEVKLIATKTGTFFLRHGSGVVAEHGVQQDFPGKCGKDGFDVWVQMNGGINNNIELLNESPDAHWNTWYVQQERDNKLFSRSGGYCFKVVQ